MISESVGERRTQDRANDWLGPRAALRIVVPMTPNVTRHRSRPPLVDRMYSTSGIAIESADVMIRKRRWVSVTAGLAILPFLLDT